MSDVTQMTDEALVNAFTDSVMEVRCDGTGGDPSPIQRLQYQEQHTELLRRLRARSVEGLVERVRILLKDDGTSHDPYVRPDQIYALICEWAGETDGQ